MGADTTKNVYYNTKKKNFKKLQASLMQGAKKQ